MQSPSIDAEQIPPVTRVGSAFGAGVVAAIVASLPATMRLGGGGSMTGAVGIWLALAAIATPLAVASVGILRRAQSGAQHVAGDRLEVLGAALLSWTTLQLLFTAVLGSLLRKHTHHHGLAGVTFAFGALASGVFLALLLRRAATKLASMSKGAHRAALVATALTTFVAVIAAGMRTAPAEDLGTAAGLVDALALGIACAIGSFRSLSRRRLLALGGVPMAVLVLVLGSTSLHGDGALRDAVAKRAPIHGMLLSVLP